MQSVYGVDLTVEATEAWDAAIDSLETAGWVLSVDDRPDTSPFARGTKEMPSGTAEVVIYFGGHLAPDGGVVVEWDRLIVSVEHELRGP